MRRLVLDNEEHPEGREEIHVAEDLNFKQKPKCKHFFRRISSSKVECVKCGVGFFDNGDFPIKEMNDFYKK